MQPSIRQLHRARMLIERAEAELGRLSPGMRRDLLKDNLPYDSELCDAAANAISREDGLL